MKELVDLSHSVSRYCVGMEGNVSAKISSTTFLIKASGVRLDRLDTSDLVEYDFDGNQLNNFDKKGSMELGFHKYLLKHSHVNFVSHTHPSNTLKILCSEHAELFANTRLFPDQVVFNDERSCLVPYAKPGEDLTQCVRLCVSKFLNTNKKLPKLILLKNHGIIACGHTADECVMITDICEKAADLFIGATMLGNMTTLTSLQIESLAVDSNEEYRRSLL